MRKPMYLAVRRWALSSIALCAVLLHPFPAAAQDPTPSRAVAFGVSPQLTEIPPVVSEKPPDETNPDDLKVKPLRTFRVENAGPADSVDPVVQESLPTEDALPSPLVSFEGVNSDDNAAAFGSRVMPPDTVGDVGPNHYVQMVNNMLRVYDKSGTPLTPALTLGSVWAAIGAPCGNTNDGDPIVLYDPLADRWMLSQFCTVANPFNHQLIAISQTPDPAGAYYLYDFMMPNNKFNDYPKFGVWPDAYYMTDNQFNQAATAFLGAGVFAFDRLKMLAGDPTASYVYFDVENGNPQIGGMVPVDLDGPPPPAGTPGYFAYFTANEFTDAAHPFDSIRIFEFRPNFANPASSTFAERADSPVLVASFDPRNPAGRDDIEQPPPANSGSFLDAIADRLMYRLQYRNFGTYESLVVNHTVNASGVAPTTAANYRAGIRYYELRRSLPGGSFTVHEQATFAPDGIERWMGSAAIDGNGNLAVGYSASSSTSFPSIRYAGRLATDPPGGLFQGETILISGTGSQTATQSRWGDYSSLNVDPADECTFWFTSEYLTAASATASSFGWLTRIGNFSFPSCTPAANGTIEGVVTNAATGLPIPGAVVQTADGYIRTTGVPGTYSMTVAAGTYGMTASAPGYLPASAPGVVVTTNHTTVQNFALSPMPILQTAPGAAIVTEGCSLPNAAIDPGETVTVSLPVRNVGTAATVNLIGTLLPGGGVTSPGAPQAYGVVGIGGTAARNFTFVAGGTCGGTVTATLQLTDGVSNLGLVTYTFTLGSLNPLSVTSTTSSGDVGVALPDLTTVEIPLNVSDLGAVTDVNVRLRLNHTFDGDLSISLIGPDGTVVDLSSGNGGSGDNFGSGANSCSGTPTVFDDSAPAAITSGTAPFAGAFRPEGSLAAFNGKPSAGTWKLRIADVAGGDTGALFCFQLEIARRLFACCGVPGTPVVQKIGSAIAGESCAPANNAVDPDETVAVSFELANAGSGPTGNLVATLLPTGGVQTPGLPQSYGVLPAGGTASRSFSFVPAGTCGGTVTATLQLQDGPLDLGTVSFPLKLGTTVGNSYGPFANPGAIQVPGVLTSTSGVAGPYPSTINVSGITGTVTKVRARLLGMSHTFPGDVDVLLVGPAGQKVILMSDVGGGIDLVNVNLTLEDGAPAIPLSGPIVSGTFSPTNSGAGDTFAAPAPAGPHGAALAAFNGTNPNGAWSLFVVDDANLDRGSLAGGWSLSFETADPVCCRQACSLACSPPVTVGNTVNRCDGVAAFPFPVVTGSCGTVACAPLSGSVFPVGTTTDICTATTQSLATTACSFPVTVQDVQPPVITGAGVDKTSLWPPNHHMETVTVIYGTGDNCTATAAVQCSLGVASNEPVNGTGDGDTSPDWTVVDNHQVQLRAERSGTGTGRVYTVTITCTDAAGRSSIQPVTVTVPHSQ